MVDFSDLNVSEKLEEDAKHLGWVNSIQPFVVKANVQQEAQKVRGKVDVIQVLGNGKLNRLASDCWEVDVIGSPEVHDEKDFMHQLNSGIDYVIARACAEKGIAIELNFSNVLATHGRQRAVILARMAQNVRICRDVGCSVIITSGAKDRYGLRSPRDLMAFGVVLGMSLEEAKAAVSLNPGKLLKRSEDRRDPNILLNGLRVKKWVSKPKEKKIYGWY